MVDCRVFLNVAFVAFATFAFPVGLVASDSERVASIVEISATDEPPPPNVATVSQNEKPFERAESDATDGGDNAPTHVARLRRRAFVRGAFFSRFISMHLADAAAIYVDSWAAFLVAIG